MKPKIIYIAPTASSFVLSDIKGLEKYFEVKCILGGWANKFLLPLRFIQQLFQLLIVIPNSKAVLISFGGYWSVLPSLISKLFKVKCFIILNGTDSVALPSINYGSLRKRGIKKACEVSYKNATMLLPVSEALWYSENTYLEKDKIFEQGIHFNFPKISTPYKVVPNGLDADFWKNHNQVREEKSFVTVFSTGKEILKGVDIILEAAQTLPHCTFYFVGAQKASNQLNLKNVHFVGRQSPEELVNTYNKAQFYLQLSVFEGFGLALCEAMLCGCVPLVSNVNMLPEICGLPENVLHIRSAQKLKTLINNAILNYGKAQANLARNRITRKYSLDKRIETIKTLIEV